MKINNFESLKAPFDEDEIHWVPIRTVGLRALVVPYIDVRSVQDRLDRAFDPDGWQVNFQPLPTGEAICVLRFRDGFACEWIEKSDVGAAPPRPRRSLWRWLFGDARDGDRLKAAFSDALKRTAVQLGIGRYLHRIEPVWVDYDPRTRQPLQRPKLSPSVLPPA